MNIRRYLFLLFLLTSVVWIPYHSFSHMAPTTPIIRHAELPCPYQAGMNSTCASSLTQVWLNHDLYHWPHIALMLISLLSFLEFFLIRLPPTEERFRPPIHTLSQLIDL